MRISDWSSDVCSSDLRGARRAVIAGGAQLAVGRLASDAVEGGQRGAIIVQAPRGETAHPRTLRRPGALAVGTVGREAQRVGVVILDIIGPGDLLRPFGARRGAELVDHYVEQRLGAGGVVVLDAVGAAGGETGRSEEHTSELQSLMRISYAVF